MNVSIPVYILPAKGNTMPDKKDRLIHLHITPSFEKQIKELANLCQLTVAETIRRAIKKGGQAVLDECKAQQREENKPILAKEEPVKVRPGPQTQVFAKTGYDEIDPSATKAR
jgi:hypothetical protein